MLLNNLIVVFAQQDIQQLPWENMPVLRDHCVTRMPSLQFIQSHNALVSEVSVSKGTSMLKARLSLFQFCVLKVIAGHKNYIQQQFIGTSLYITVGDKQTIFE